MSDNSNPNYNIMYIDTDEQLVAYCQRIESAEVLFLDTEFVREKTYYARLCLIQIAANGLYACIDPLSINDLKPLMDIIYSPGKLKVLHAARQDYEIFHDLNGELPCPIFDTQMAASLLGYGEQTGYGALVSKVLGVGLDKTQARTDWSMRPLNEKQIKYAADDVYYLEKIYPVLQQKLQEKNRHDWLDDDFAALCEKNLYIVKPTEAWKKLKGVNRLKARQLAACQKLAEWRENVAIKTNKPRRWVLADDTLTIIAQLLPNTIDELKKIRGLRSKDVADHGEAILTATNYALKLDKSALPEVTAINRPTAEQEVTSDLLMTELRLLAHKNDISATNLATRKDISKLVSGNHDIALLTGWRNQIAGKHIMALLNGQTCLHITNKSVTISEK